MESFSVGRIIDATKRLQHRNQQQQHCLAPQLVQNTCTPVTWFLFWAVILDIMNLNLSNGRLIVVRFTCRYPVHLTNYKTNTFRLKFQAVNVLQPVAHIQCYILTSSR
uniref:Uncharacterized protein n=1 Tax=Rhizophora mucronata TaxID=61149 RepID=A0A2P2IRZ6_RHIMU